jgi:hypothetical protein
MKPRVHALGCSAMRDSHAKCVKIYVRSRSRQAILCGFRLNLTMAPTLLNRRKGSGRTQPFTLGSMKKNQAAVVKLCPVSADGGVSSCTEKRRLAISDWLSISFRPTIRSSIELKPKPPVEILFHQRGRKLYRADDGVKNFEINPKVSLARGRSATRKFLGPDVQKQLVRSRVKIL